MVLGHQSRTNLNKRKRITSTSEGLRSLRSRKEPFGDWEEAQPAGGGLECGGQTPRGEASKAGGNSTGGECRSAAEGPGFLGGLGEPQTSLRLSSTPGISLKIVSRNTLTNQPSPKTSKNGFRVVFLDTYENPSQNSHFQSPKVPLFLGKTDIFRKLTSRKGGSRVKAS